MHLSWEVRSHKRSQESLNAKTHAEYSKRKSTTHKSEAISSLNWELSGLVLGLIYIPQNSMCCIGLKIHKHELYMTYFHYFKSVDFFPVS